MEHLNTRCGTLVYTKINTTKFNLIGYNNSIQAHCYTLTGSLYRYFELQTRKKWKRELTFQQQ